MKIGSGWTKDKDGKTFISVTLDEVILKLCPQLKDCNISLGYIDKDDRKSEKSPGWVVNLYAKKEKKSEDNIEDEEVQQYE